jgi:bifunctional UDP-N-acetylglucosamine pyrophosphorylase / glucosamine-1-phosphate N-acetyltransferase
MKTDVIVLAAGKGTRMYSDIPKVLHEIAGKPMLGHVLQAATDAGADRIHLVTGFQSELIRSYVESFAPPCSLILVEQAEQLGTGHAVMQAVPAIEDDSIILVLYGDVPLISADTLKKLAAQAADSGIALLTLRTDQPEGLGRIIRDSTGKIVAIIEEKDASAEQKKIEEINSGIMAFRAAMLQRWLKLLNTNNAQQEYYLTDVVAIANQEGVSVSHIMTSNASEVQGVNNRLQLAELERSYQLQQARALALKGVTLRDPARFDLRGELSMGRDVTLDINVIIQGKVSLGNRVSIGPNVTIIDSHIGDDTIVLANSHIEGTVVGSACTVGPFARLREGTELGNKAKIGNFVETKKASIGQGSKANHLSYIGDTIVGESVNIGAGTITCNYDGVNKHKTVIKSGAFIGSNTALVAPVTVGENANVAAGSVINKDVADRELAVARGRQRNIPGWKRPEKI